jgi:LuxR family transcriptional regulator, maltose regulon positive regulatory protein
MSSSAPTLAEVLERHPDEVKRLLRLFVEAMNFENEPLSFQVTEEASQLKEALSAGQLRVLRYLPSHLSAPEIGRELNLSINTVKAHLREIYAKLDVHRRSDAVESARRLRLLTRPLQPAL